MALRVLGRIGAEDIGTERVACNDSTSGELDSQAVMGCNRAATRNPLRDKGWLNAKEGCQDALVAAVVDGLLDGQIDHAHGR